MIGVQIDPSSKISGVSTTRVRDMLRKNGIDSYVNLQFVCDELDLTQARGTRLLRAMERGGYLIDRKNRTWELTSSGIQLRAANATKPLHRVIADRLLSDLLERIELVNADDHYLARVTKAVVFGSYLSTSSRLGDIDVAVQLTRREPNMEKHMAANLERVQESSRVFSTFVDQLDWWRDEVYLFLRNRKRGLSIHDYDAIRETVDSSPHRVVFP